MGMNDLIERVAQDPRGLLKGQPFFLRQRKFDLLPGAAATHGGGHRQAYVADAVQSLLERRNREHASTVERQRMNYLADRQSHGEPGTTFEFDQLRAGCAGFVEDLFLD